MTRDPDPDRRLALAYVPLAKRAALDTLWRLDVTFGAVLAAGREPMITRIRLAWWREALEALDRAPPPAEPMLQAIARDVLPAGLSGADLAAMEKGWSVLAEADALPSGTLEAHARERGGRLFALSARLLGDDGFPVEEGGQCWALTDFARHASNPREREVALAAARDTKPPKSWPKALRPLGMLTALARRDAAKGRLEPQGSPSRMLRMLAHRLSGI